MDRWAIFRHKTLGGLYLEVSSMGSTKKSSDRDRERDKEVRKKRKDRSKERYSY